MGVSVLRHVPDGNENQQCASLPQVGCCFALGLDWRLNEATNYIFAHSGVCRCFAFNRLGSLIEVDLDAGAKRRGRSGRGSRYN
jgi:hypothetical protein